MQHQDGARSAGPAAMRTAPCLSPLVWDGRGDGRLALNLLTHKAVEFAIKVVLEQQAGSRRRGLPHNGDELCFMMIKEGVLVLRGKWSRRRLVQTYREHINQNVLNVARQSQKGVPIENLTRALRDWERRIGRHQQQQQHPQQQQPAQRQQPAAPEKRTHPTAACQPRRQDQQQQGDVVGAKPPRMTSQTQELAQCPMVDLTEEHAARMAALAARIKQARSTADPIVIDDSDDDDGEPLHDQDQAADYMDDEQHQQQAEQQQVDADNGQQQKPTSTTAADDAAAAVTDPTHSTSSSGRKRARELADAEQGSNRTGAAAERADAHKPSKRTGVGAPAAVAAGSAAAAAAGNMDSHMSEEPVTDDAADDEVVQQQVSQHVTNGELDMQQEKQPQDQQHEDVTGNNQQQEQQEEATGDNQQQQQQQQQQQEEAIGGIQQRQHHQEGATQDNQQQQEVTGDHLQQQQQQEETTGGRQQTQQEQKADSSDLDRQQQQQQQPGRNPACNSANPAAAEAAAEAGGGDNDNAVLHTVTAPECRAQEGQPTQQDDELEETVDLEQVHNSKPGASSSSCSNINGATARSAGTAAAEEEEAIDRARGLQAGVQQPDSAATLQALTAIVNQAATIQQSRTQLIRDVAKLTSEIARGGPVAAELRGVRDMLMADLRRLDAAAASIQAEAAAAAQQILQMAGGS